MTSKIDEEIFKPLYTTEKGDNRVGRPNVPIRILVAMIILKEGVGCSDEQLYEYCRFNLLYRRALGMVSLDELCPTLDSYYGFRRKLCKHEEMFKENLFDKCFNQITKQQALAFFVEDAAKTVLFLCVTREKSQPKEYRIPTIPMQSIVARIRRE